VCMGVYVGMLVGGYVCVGMWVCAFKPTYYYSINNLSFCPGDLVDLMVV